MSLNDPPDPWRAPLPEQQPTYPPASPPPDYPAPGYPPPGAPPQQHPGRRQSLLIGLAGFLVAAIIAVILCVTGVMPVRGSGSQPDAGPVSLPTKVGTYVRFQDAPANQDARAKRTVTARETSDRKTAAALREAYNGAGASVQSYASRDLQNMFSVWAVRASSPGLVEAYVNPRYLGLAAAPQAVQRYGAVTCEIVQTMSKPAGQKPEGAIAPLCQRTAHGLTVSVRASGGDLAKHPHRVVALVNQVWDALH